MKKTFVKKDVIKELSKRSGLEELGSKMIIETLVDIIKEKVNERNEVIIRGFGRFYLRTTSGKVVQNISKRETFKMPPYDNVAFKVARTWKDELKLN